LQRRAGRPQGPTGAGPQGFGPHRHGTTRAAAALALLLAGLVLALVAPLAREAAGLFTAAPSVQAAQTFATSDQGATERPELVLYAELDGPVTPAMADLLDKALTEARERGARLLLLRLDTPGGLLESARSMVQAILNAPLPVAVWVGPSGAHAASAGVFLVAASHVAAMAPAASMGSASPVNLGGESMDKTMAKKVQNDILSLLRSIVAQRGRNVEWYEASVTEAASIDTAGAVLGRVVEYAANDPDDFLAQIGARGVPFGDGTVRIDPARIRVEQLDPGFRHGFLSWLLHPQVAYLLFIGGLAGLFFELTTPGAILPGVLGTICLLLGLYSLSVLPTTVAGVLLILFGLVLFLLEIKIVSYGLLSVAAVVSLFMGSVILFRGGPHGFALPLSTVVVTVGGIALLLGAAVVLAGRAQRAKDVTGAGSMVGLRATVRSWQADQGKVLVRGELWNARSATPFEAAPGDPLRVVAVQGLTVVVIPEEAAPNAMDPHAPPEL
jgi:membrane-bound serine protease (ClpP class)